MTDATDRRGITPDRPVEYDDEGNAELYELDSGTRSYDTVIGQVTASLQAIEERLKLLREQKERIRVEIKQLVSQQRILERMERIAAKDTDVGE